jgi:hypothetical protein
MGINKESIRSGSIDFCAPALWVNPYALRLTMEQILHEPYF